MTNIINHYEPDTFPVKVYSKSNNCRVEYIRLRIGGDRPGDTNIILLYNGDCYISKDYTALYWSQEISVEDINERLQALENLFYQLGNIKSLQTYNKTNFVSAINELASITTTPRNLKGIISWVVNDAADVHDYNDLDIVYVLNTKAFYYYSKALNELVSLPEGWIQLPLLVRSANEVTDNITDYSNQTIGILEENEIYKVIEQKLIKITAPKTNIGDEYIVRNVLETNKQGSLIYLPTGWTYLIS